MSYQRRHGYGCIWFLVIVSALLTVTETPPPFPTVLVGIAGTVEAEEVEGIVPNQKIDKLERPADFFVSQDRAGYLGYTIEKRKRTALLDYGDGSTSNHWVDVEYIAVIRPGEAFTFDADVYFGAGNSADFGYFPFLGGSTKQLFISQDVSRGGRQWIATLSPSFEVIFNGEELNVGREASDFSAADFDRDGIYELILPITDFYAFQDKMSMANIPLPNIIFKYHPGKRRYLPANSIFKEKLLKHIIEAPPVGQSVGSEFNHRSGVLDNLLTYIYAGEKQQGWAYFDKHYRLNDKTEIRNRVEEILRAQPVYNLIYKRKH